MTDSRSIAARAASTLTHWFGAFAAALLRTRREQGLARRTSRDLLRVYREFEATQPELTAVARYREVVARQTGLDARDVRTVLERAESSFARWPEERPLRFRDVVLYLVVHGCLNADPGAIGIRSSLATIVADEIPEEI